MSTATSRTVLTSEGEAVPLPAEMAYGEGVELTLERSGEVLTIRPAKAGGRKPLSGRELVEALAKLPLEHGWPPRDTDPLPEREGL